ncbi:hypothetical protein [Micrococcus luteus]|uniref:hypothetical protein n=1 Tax=Micrococcus luteus TaxID=1270 RepID=UPI0015D84CDC|nr:hypothetical protein [Micrococcus luteus]
MSVRGETLAGARLAAGLIRVARRHGDAQDHTALLEEHGLGGPDALPVRERLALAGRLSRWAGRLRPVFAADGPRDRADAAAALLEGVPIRALLSASAGPETSPVWRFTAASADGSGSLDDVLGQVQVTTAGALAWLVVDGEGDRLGLCGVRGREGPRPTSPVLLGPLSRRGRRADPPGPGLAPRARRWQPRRRGMRRHGTPMRVAC